MTATLGVFVLRNLPLAAVGFVVGLLSLAGIIQKFDPFFGGSVCVVATECGVLLREPSLS